MVDPEEAPDSWHWSGPAQAAEAILGINQHMEDLNLSF